MRACDRDANEEAYRLAEYRFSIQLTSLRTVIYSVRESVLINMRMWYNHSIHPHPRLAPVAPLLLDVQDPHNA